MTIENNHVERKTDDESNLLFCCFSKQLPVKEFASCHQASFVPVKTGKRSFRKARSALNDCCKDSVMKQHTDVMVRSPDVLMKGGSRRCRTCDLLLISKVSSVSSLSFNSEKNSESC